MSATLDPSALRRKPRTIAASVLSWWDIHRRSLPWRAPAGEAADPYRVWLSEILLQQTTAAGAAPYFQNFVAHWPDIDALAAAPLEAIMQAFAGLGYYSRARNLHACAKTIAARGGRFPRDEAELRALPGVGPYTAAAIAAIAFDAPAAPVDGNIARIVSRLHAFETPIASNRPAIDAAARALTPSARSGDFAQAMMDIGSAICTPRNPDCGRCPLRPGCAAAARGDPAAYPRREARKARPQRRGAAFFAQRADGGVLLRTRPPEGLLGGTVELPGTAWTSDFEPERAARAAPFAASWRLAPGLVEQAFTHFSLALNIYVARIGASAPAPEGCYWVAPEALPGAALSSVMRKAVAHGQRFAGQAQEDEPVASLNRRRNGSWATGSSSR